MFATKTPLFAPLIDTADSRIENNSILEFNYVQTIYCGFPQYKHMFSVI